MRISSKWLKISSPFRIKSFTSGDNPFEITTISQTHFTPLSDALFDCIVKLNSLKIEANLANIIQQLWIEFPTIELPSEIALKSMLSMMCNEKKLVYDPIKLNYNIGDLDSASSSSSSSSSLMPKSSSTTLMGKTIANKLGNFFPKIDQSSSSSSSTSSARNHLDSRERQQRKKIPNNCDSNDNRCSFSPDPNDTSERTKPSEKIEKLNYLIKLSSSTPTATDCSIIDEININCDDDDDDDDADNSGGKLRQEKSKKSSNFNRSRSIRSMTGRNVKSSSLPSTATTSSMLMHANRSSSIASTKTVQQNVTMADDLIIIKRRLFRLNSNARIKSSTLPVAICSTAANLITKNFLDFGSQFPDEQMLATQNKSMLIQSINLPRNQIAVNYCSKGTQTVKSGSDEIVTVLRRATMACCRLSSPSSSYADHQKNQTVEKTSDATKSIALRL
ncbi:Polycystic kidney disease protein 1-like 3 [Sarcoptes scabiei]|nr:Polycystic kidney disease protein 1-like 3 [Sarcoptes scabiei]